MKKCKKNQLQLRSFAEIFRCCTKDILDCVKYLLEDCLFAKSDHILLKKKNSYEMSCLKTNQELYLFLLFSEFYFLVSFF